jgi:hypothetical protein
MNFNLFTYYQAELILQQLDQNKRYEGLKGLVPSESSNKRCISIGMDQGKNNLDFFSTYMAGASVYIYGMKSL